MPTGERPKQPDQAPPAAAEAEKAATPTPAIQQPEPEPPSKPEEKKAATPGPAIPPGDETILRGTVIDERSRAKSLYKLINDSFSLDDLRDMCFEMDVDYESLPGESKRGKARELVQYCRRAGRLDELSRHFQAERPHLANQLRG